MSESGACFHCALPVIDDRYRVDIDGTPRAVCCPGCKAVAELIRDSGMSRYYDLRDAPEPGIGKPEEGDPSTHGELEATSKFIIIHQGSQPSFCIFGKTISNAIAPL